MTNLTQQPVVVEQCDRDAAAALIRLYFNSNAEMADLAARIADGSCKWDTFSDAFARHRLAERERAAKVAESDALILSPSRSLRSFGGTRKAHGALIAAFIRSGKEPA